MWKRAKIISVPVELEVNYIAPLGKGPAENNAYVLDKRKKK